MQFHGTLTRSGTTDQIRAALLVAEPEQPADSLFLARQDVAEVAPVSITEILPMIGGGDTRIRLSSGDIFHLPGGSDQTALQAYYPRTAQLGTTLSRLEMVRWRGVGVLAVLFLMIAVGFRFAIAPVGDVMARMMPDHLVERASGMVLAQLDLALMEDSQLSEDDKQRITAEFQRLVALAPSQFADTRLNFRSAPAFGPNAFALPGNDVVLLDELVTYVEDDDVVLGVLAHELGHVVEQHALRQVMRSAVVAIGISLLVGAEESILEEVVGFGGTLVMTQNSRKFELEADTASADMLRRAGRDPDALIIFFAQLEANCGKMCDGGGLLASHPSLRERVSALSD
jgi:Zn-dependent protease with chaperone function